MANGAMHAWQACGNSRLSICSHVVSACCRTCQKAGSGFLCPAVGTELGPQGFVASIA